MADSVEGAICWLPPYDTVITVAPPQFSATTCHHVAKWQTECREKLASHIHSQLGLAILPIDVKLITNPEDLYQWSILTARKAALFNKQLSKHSTGAYIDLCNGAGVHFKAVLAEGAVEYEQEKQLVATSIAFDALEKSREHPSRDIITFQLSAKEWRERYNAELARREALEIEMMGIKGENAELLTEMKALREIEATRTQDLEKAREVLLITSRILQERALKASEDSQKSLPPSAAHDSAVQPSLSFKSATTSSRSMSSFTSTRCPLFGTQNGAAANESTVRPRRSSESATTSSRSTTSFTTASRPLAAAHDSTVRPYSLSLESASTSSRSTSSFTTASYPASAAHDSGVRLSVRHTSTILAKPILSLHVVARKSNGCLTRTQGKGNGLSCSGCCLGGQPRGDPRGCRSAERHLHFNPTSNSTDNFAHMPTRRPNVDKEAAPYSIKIGLKDASYSTQ
ncbi:hypothetical protein V500_02305 [Pseudogymnoascus sp. VKM F-4518 (FW-2643)]|nr:hypothetical protein V500_02305 [Pseudogymnoascus sp. VKM F-4518 (FW-2643)]